MKKIAFLSWHTGIVVLLVSLMRWWWDMASLPTLHLAFPHLPLAAPAFLLAGLALTPTRLPYLRRLLLALLALLPFLVATSWCMGHLLAWIHVSLGHHLLATVEAFRFPAIAALALFTYAVLSRRRSY